MKLNYFIFTLCCLLFGDAKLFAQDYENASRLIALHCISPEAETRHKFFAEGIVQEDSGNNVSGVLTLEIQKSGKNQPRENKGSFNFKGVKKVYPAGSLYKTEVSIYEVKPTNNAQVSFKISIDIPEVFNSQVMIQGMQFESHCTPK